MIPLGTLRFPSSLPFGLGLTLAGVLAALAWWLYRRETLASVSAPLSWLLPALRSGAIFMICMTLLEPAFEYEQRIGEPGQVVIAVDNSESMMLTDAASSSVTSTTRLGRVDRLLSGEGGLLAEVTDRFDIRVEQIGESGELFKAWDSRTEIPREGLINTKLKPARQTSLGNALEQIKKQVHGPSERDTVVVLFTDGQNNAGKSPIGEVEGLSGKTVVFSIGIGPEDGTADLSIDSVKVPSQMFSEDQLVGNVVVSEKVPRGSDYSLQVSFEGQLLWEKRFQAQAERSREFEFSFPVTKILETARAQNTAVDFAALPVKLDARVVGADDLILSNNVGVAFTSVIARKSRILLIDGRSRWETRYLKNMFSRDPAWELSTSIALPQMESDSPVSFSFRNLPRSQEALFDYDLLILGDVDSELLGDEFLALLEKFVADRGGGMIFVDGARGFLREEGYERLTSLFPVEWTDKEAELPENLVLKLTPEAMRLEAFDLGGLAGIDPAKSFWEQLPSLQFLSSVAAKPGAEVLLEAQYGDVIQPVMVTRPFGAGRVVYLASDETWRWRFRYADQFHTRWWNQIARWVMAQPYRLENDYVSLDTGKPNYGRSETVVIRGQLRDDQGRPLQSQAVTAVVQEASGEIRRFVMVENPDLPGAYRASLTELSAGNYRVRLEVAGFPTQALDIESRFSIVEPMHRELSDATCNRMLLQRMADAGHGTYLHETQVERLAELIRPLSGGRIQLARVVLWQSYGWFVVAIGLLILEWGLRKRAGLI